MRTLRGGRFLPRVPLQKLLVLLGWSECLGKVKENVGKKKKKKKNRGKATYRIALHQGRKVSKQETMSEEPPPWCKGWLQGET